MIEYARDNPSLYVLGLMAAMGLVWAFGFVLRGGLRWIVAEAEARKAPAEIEVGPYEFGGGVTPASEFEH